jgi:uncharacterized protein
MKQQAFPISDTDLEALGRFLASPARPEGTLTLHELQGFLYTVASSPEPVMPSDWMPLISNDMEMGYADVDEANAILGRIMTLYNHINERVMRGSRTLPLGCAFRKNVLANLENDAPISQWSRGFAIGHDWLSEVWNAYLPEGYDEDYGILVVTLSFFGTRELAESYIAEMLVDSPAAPDTLERIADTIRRAFPSALASYAKLGRSLVSFEA